MTFSKGCCKFIQECLRSKRMRTTATQVPGQQSRSRDALPAPDPAECRARAEDRTELHLCAKLEGGQRAVKGTARAWNGWIRSKEPRTRPASRASVIQLLPLDCKLGAGNRSGNGSAKATDSLEKLSPQRSGEGDPLLKTFKNGLGQNPGK